MKLRFLGTGAAEGAPAIFCNCKTCKILRERGEWHTRSQYLIDGVLGIEFSPDAYYHALRFNLDLSAMRELLVTHSHMDHFYAHDFILRGYKYADEPRQPLTVYGNAEVAAVFAECTRRELKPVVAENLRVMEVEPFRAFSCGAHKEYTVTPLLAQHGNTEQALVYLIEKGSTSYLHLTDTGRLPEQSLDYLEKYLKAQGKRLNFVTFDCTFLYYTAGEVSRHMGLEDNRAMQMEFLRRGVADGHTRYAITHYSHNSDPLRERLERAGEEYGYIPAFDGMTVEIE